MNIKTENVFAKFKDKVNFHMNISGIKYQFILDKDYSEVDMWANFTHNEEMFKIHFDSKNPYRIGEGRMDGVIFPSIIIYDDMNQECVINNCEYKDIGMHFSAKITKL
jgi:hypothetical protein